MVFAIAGCGGTTNKGYCDEGADIVGGAAAPQYPEAALVDMYQGGELVAKCSGALIAPSVVLTAGHCVDGYDGWSVLAPYALKQRVSSSSGATYDWAEDSGTTVNPDHHDVGLVFLDAPITIAGYPAVAGAPQPDGTDVVNIGRIGDGALSDTDAFVSSPVSIADGTSDGYPLDYSANDVIQHGDSGGPVELADGSHTIVAVNSGVGGSSEVLARVDLVGDWIATQVSAHGGAAPTPTPPPGAPAGGGAGSRSPTSHRSASGARDPCAH